MDAANGTEDNKGGIGAIFCHTYESGLPPAFSYASLFLSDSE